MNAQFRLNRRFLLQGAGTAIALPVLEAMLDSTGQTLAQGGAASPKRLATWVYGNGVIPSRWRPSATGPGWQASEELAPLFDPQYPGVKNYVNVLSGFNMKTPSNQMHHDGQCAMLSATPIIEIQAGSGCGDHSSKFGGPSIDQIAAPIIGKTTFPTLEIGVSKRAHTKEGPTMQYISHKGPDAPVPPEFSPAALFNRLFDNFIPAGGGTQPDPRARLKVSVLDAVRDQTTRLNARLGSADRARLDLHLTAISELRNQIQVLPPVESASCAKPVAPTSKNVDVGGTEPVVEVSRAMSDILALAWACDLNRVASFAFFIGNGFTMFSNLGHSNDEHAITHSSAQDKVHETVVFTMKEFTYFLNRLMKTPDGTGNLLDSACILAVTDCALGATHATDDMPILIAGKAGGFLKYPGVHFRSPDGQNTSDALFTCMSAVGTGVTSVGKAEGLSSTVVSGILA